MKKDFNLPRQWPLGQKAVVKIPEEVAKADLFLRAYQQMLDSGQTRPYNYYSFEHGANDPYFALTFMQGWFNPVFEDRLTDFTYGGCFNLITPPVVRHKDRWKECTDLNNIHAASNLNLGFIQAVLETQVKRHPVAFPAPMATKILRYAVKTGQAIRPYLDGSKKLEHPKDQGHMHDILVDIVNMITFIGACTGLSKQMVEDLKSEIIAPTMEGQGFDLKFDNVVVESTPRPATREKQPLMEIRWRR